MCFNSGLCAGAMKRRLINGETSSGDGENTMTPHRNKPTPRGLVVLGAWKIDSPDWEESMNGEMIAILGEGVALASSRGRL